ncbi:MAG TPA: hypothetical protein VG103_09835, partial [Chthoniobacterales bacterium]|nr:hypothetical protein [Chthoniobacterales bacterium]
KMGSFLRKSCTHGRGGLRVKPRERALKMLTSICDGQFCSNRPSELVDLLLGDSYVTNRLIRA